MPEPSDVVVVTNNESLPFTIKYNKREYKLTPGHPVFLPFEAACLWFGDPRSQGNIQSYTGTDGLVAFVPDRATEVRRLRMKWGMIYGPETTFEGYRDAHGKQGDQVHIPDVSVATPDGEKLWMVVEDPAGNHVEAATLTVSDTGDLLAQLRRQQAQINLLMEQISGDTATLPTVSEDGDLLPPADDDQLVKGAK